MTGERPQALITLGIRGESIRLLYFSLSYASLCQVHSSLSVWLYSCGKNLGSHISQNFIACDFS